MILLRSFLSGHIRIKRTLEYYDAGIGPRVPFGGGFGPTVSANFATALNDFTTLSSTSTMPPGGSISRAGNAMLYDSTGKLTYAPNNLLLWSQDFRDTTQAGSSRPWNYQNVAVDTGVTAPDGTTTAQKIRDTNTGASSVQHLIFQTSNFAAGIRYVVSIYAQAAGKNWLRFNSQAPGSYKNAYFNLSNGTVGTVDSGGFLSPTINPVAGATGWYRISLVVPATITGDLGWLTTTGDGVTTNIGDGVSGVNLWGGQVEAVTYQTTPSTYVATTTSAYYGPRFDYDPVTSQPKGLLVEGQLQQLLSWSEDFRDTAAAGSTRPWSYVYATVSPNVTTAPDGSSNADALNEDATNNFNHLVGQTVTKAASALTYTFSTYIKAAGRNWSCITLWDGSANGIRFWYNVTLGAGAKGSQTSFGTGFSAVNYTITDVGNGWYRCSGTVVTNTATSLVSYIYSVSGDLNLAPVTALNAAGLYLFGAQLEARAFPTSYLPTQGGTSPFATRAAETFSLTGYANRLVEAYYIDEQTGANYSGNSALSTGTVTISPPTFGWVTSLRAYTNAYAGSISSPSWLSFSRAGNAMYYDSTGTLTYAPVNELPSSNGFTNTTYWLSSSTYGPTVSSSTVLSPDGTTNATKAIYPSISGAGNTGVLYTAASYRGTQTIGVNYLFSVYLRGDVGGETLWIMGTPNGSTFTRQAVTLTTSWQRFVLPFAPTATNFLQIGVDLRDGSQSAKSAYTIYVYGAQLEPVTYQTAPSAYIPTTSAAVYGPRYDYDPSTVPATPRGLLIEESRQNLLLQSQTFNTSWTLNNILAFGSGSIADAITAPDGTTTADKIVENTSTASHFVNQTATVTNGASYTYSVYAKAGERKYLSIFCINTAAAANTFFNLSNGTVVSTSSGATSSITSVGNGWYRCSVTTTTTSTTSGIYPGISPDGVNASYAGDGVSGVYLWGAQLEAGSFATSYIPTTTASVTRAADVAQLTGSALTTLQGSAFSAIVDTRFYNGSTTSGIALGGPAGQSAILYAAASSQVNNFSSGASPAVLGPATAGTGTWESGVRVGISNSSTGRSLVMGNGTVVTSAGPLVAALSSVQLGSYASGTQYGSGWYRSFAAYNQKLPDAILKQKSSVGAPY